MKHWYGFYAEYMMNIRRSRPKLNETHSNTLWVVHLVILIVSVALLVAFWFLFVQRTDVKKEYVIEDANGRSFSAPFSQITSFGISGDNWNETKYLYDGVINLSLRIEDEEGNPVFDETFFGISIANYSIADYDSLLDQPIQLLQGKSYKIFCKSNNDRFTHMTIALYGERGSLLRWYLAVSLLVILSLQTGAYLSLKTSLADGGPADAGPSDKTFSLKAGILFFLEVVLIGMLYEVVLPPFSVQDEPSHLATSYMISNEILGETRYAEADKKLVYIPESAIHRMNWAGSAQEIYRFWCDPDYSGTSDTIDASARLYDVGANIPRYVYYIPALGITIARLLHLPYQWIVLSGRIANLLFSAFMLLMILRLCPRFKRSVIAIAILPASIWLFSSYSYDAWNLLWTLLLVTFCVYCRDKGGPVNWKDIIAFTAISCVTLPVKFLYFPLLACVFFIPWKKMEMNISKVILIFLGICCIATAMIYTRLGDAVSLATTNAVDTRSLEGIREPVQTFTAQWILSNPVLTLKILAHALASNGVGYIRTAFAGEWTGLTITNGFALVIILLFLIVVLADLPHKYVMVKDRILSVALFLGNSLLILISFLLLYSYIPSDGSLPELHGVQGRYFLPLFILLPFWGGFEHPKISQKTKRVLLYGLLICNVVCVLIKVAGIAMGKGLLVRTRL